jgi:hypothetical protein
VIDEMPDGDLGRASAGEAMAKLRQPLGDDIIGMQLATTDRWVASTLTAGVILTARVMEPPWTKFRVSIDPLLYGAHLGGVGARLT